MTAFRLPSSVSTIVPRAASATAVEVSDDSNLCYWLLLSVKFFLFLLSLVVGLVKQDGKPDGNYNNADAVPTPKVIIDLDSDPDATIVEITFGDRLGALLDTV